MKRAFFLLGFFLSFVTLAQEYVENLPAARKGHSYTGYMKDGKYHGQGAYSYDFKDGFYSGGWKEGQKHGEGITTLFEQTKISGTWVNGQLTGKTSFEYPLDGSTMYRHRENGQYGPEFRIEYSTKAVFEGLAPEGSKEGVFTLTFKDGEQITLTFKDDDLVGGDGVIRDNYAYSKAYKGGTYSGEWLNGQPHGKGSYQSTSEFYRGNWANGLKDGFGYRAYSSGDSYLGMFKENKLNGEGMFRFQKSKAYYEGTFKDNRQHGQGKTTTAIGSTSSGNFLMGKWHGEITFIDTNGKVTSKIYENGTEVKEVAAEVITEPKAAVAQVESKVKESQYPDKLEGDYLMRFLFTKYENKEVKYWLEKHPDQLFDEYDWKFTTTGLEIAYYTGKFGKDADSWDKPLYDRKAMHVEVSQGFDGKLPGGMEYNTFIDAIIQEKYHLLSEYYSRVSPLPYTLSYSSTDDHWDDFVMTLKNGEGSIWVHGIKGFPSSFKVQFRPNSYESTVAKHNAEKKWMSDRANKGGDCITCQLENQGKKRVFSGAELDYMAAVRDAKVDLSFYKNHPQLKYLGRSVHDPEVAALIKKDAQARGKSGIVSLGVSRYQWEDRLESEVVREASKKGYWYILDEISGTIAGVIFIRREDKFWKQKAYKGNVPAPEKWIEVLTLRGMEVYRISPDKEAPILAENLNTHTTQLLRQRVNQDLLIKTQADLDRFLKPRGEDIWLITGVPTDELLNKTLFANKWAYDQSYKYSLDQENQYWLAGNSGHVLLTRKYGYGYDYKFSKSSDNDFKNGYFPLDIRIEFDLNILLPQVFRLPEFIEASYKDRTEKVFNREVTRKVIQIKLNTPHGIRYMIIDKYEDQEGGRFSDITFSSDTGFMGDGTPLTQTNNPWKAHNENVVLVSKDDEKRYINAFERLFINMENGYADFADERAVLQDDDYRTVYLSDALEIPNAITGYSSLSKYKTLQAAWYKIKVTEATKDEYINTLFRKKWNGNYRITAPEVDEQSTFGKGFIVEKNNQVIGILQFESHVTEPGIWWMEAHTFNEDAFEKSFEKVMTQANEDNYDSWKGLPAGEESFLSSYSVYNGRMTFISDTLTAQNNKETNIRFVFENTPSYVLDFIIRKWQNTATSFSKEVRFKENFRLPNTTTRLVTFDFKATEFLLGFNATHKNLNAIELRHGGNYEVVTEKMATPMNLEKATELAVKAMEPEGYEVVWTHTDDWQFLMLFNSRFGSQTGNIAGDYLLTVVYESTIIPSTFPSFGLSGEYEGENISLRGKREDANALMDGYMYNGIKFTLGNENANYRVGGSYGYKDDGLKISVVLFKKK